MGTTGKTYRMPVRLRRDLVAATREVRKGADAVLLAAIPTDFSARMDARNLRSALARVGDRAVLVGNLGRVVRDLERALHDAERAELEGGA